MLHKCQILCSIGYFNVILYVHGKVSKWSASSAEELRYKHTVIILCTHRLYQLCVVVTCHWRITVQLRYDENYYTNTPIVSSPVPLHLHVNVNVLKNCMWQWDDTTILIGLQNKPRNDENYGTNRHYSRQIHTLIGLISSTAPT